VLPIGLSNANDPFGGRTTALPHSRVAAVFACSGNVMEAHRYPDAAAPYPGDGTGNAPPAPAANLGRAASCYHAASLSFTR